MLGMKFNDPHKIVTEMMADYVLKELGNNSYNKTVESLAYVLAGICTSRRYRRDLAEPERNLIAREYLRGVLADHYVG
jgi:hypothetical protein